MPEPPKLAAVASAYTAALDLVDSDGAAEMLTAAEAPPHAGDAVDASENFEAAMSGVLVPADAEFAAAAIHADLQLAARLVQYLPVEGPQREALLGRFFDDLGKAIKALKSLIDGAPDPKPSGKQISDDLQASYDSITGKTAGSLDADLGYLGVETLMDVLHKVEELPVIGEELSRLEQWITRLLKSAVAKLVKLIGRASADEVVKAAENWLKDHLSLEVVTVAALSTAFDTSGAVAALKHQLASAKVSQPMNDRTVVAIDALVASNGRTIDALDAAAKVSEDVVGMAGSVPAIESTPQLPKYTIPAARCFAALLIAVDETECMDQSMRASQSSNSGHAYACQGRIAVVVTKRVFLAPGRVRRMAASAVVARGIVLGHECGGRCAASRSTKPCKSPGLAIGTTIPTAANHSPVVGTAGHRVVAIGLVRSDAGGSVNAIARPAAASTRPRREQQRDRDQSWGLVPTHGPLTPRPRSVLSRRRCGSLVGARETAVARSTWGPFRWLSPVVLDAGDRATVFEDTQCW